MAKKTGLVLVGLAGVLIAATAGAFEKEKKPTEPSPSQPKPAPGTQGPVTECVRTSPGDGPKNGKAAAVKAWQRCLINAGCLPAGTDDGEHGPQTEAASKNFEAGTCNQGQTSQVSSDRVYYLTLALTPAPSVAAATLSALTAPSSSEASVVAQFKTYARNWMKNEDNRKRNPNGQFYVQSSRTDNQTADVRTVGQFVESGEEMPVA
jgi:hypothetical protein